MQVSTFTSDFDWLVASRQFICQTIQDCLANETIVRLALSGGSTPKPVYDSLAKESIPFDRLELFQVDERYVPPESSDLNANMLRETILKDATLFRGYHLFDTALTLQNSMQVYEEMLAKLPQPLFHLTILGIGPDGHTASLFPHSPALASDQLVASTSTEVFAGRDRLTLTPKALLASETILILVNGREKSAITNAFIEGKAKKEDLPIMCIHEHKNIHLFWQNG